VRLCNPYVLARPRTTSTDAPRNPSMLAPSQQKKSKQVKKRKKSLLDPGRHFPVPYFYNCSCRITNLLFIRRRGVSRQIALHTIKNLGLPIHRSVAASPPEGTTKPPSSDPAGGAAAAAHTSTIKAPVVMTGLVERCYGSVGRIRRVCSGCRSEHGHVRMRQDSFILNTRVRNLLKYKNTEN
jgi:hypothetical protein